MQKIGRDYYANLDCTNMNNSKYISIRFIRQYLNTEKSFDLTSNLRFLSLTVLAINEPNTLLCEVWMRVNRLSFL